MIFTRSETNVCDTIKKYMTDIETDEFCSRICKVKCVTEMFSYMLTAETKKILLRHKFAKFCVTLMNKCIDLNREADDHKRRLGAWGIGGIETYDEYNKLIEKLVEMMMFLEDNNVPSPYASSKSPTKPVKPVKTVSIQVKVLPRRSARLMAAAQQHAWGQQQEQQQQQEQTRTNKRLKKKKTSLVTQ